MKSLLIAVVLLCAHIQCVSAEQLDDDTIREMTFQAMWAIDWKQTRDFNGRMSDTLHETNVVLGEHPSAGAINRYFVAGAVIHYAISLALPSEYRQYWQMFTIGYEASTVANNIRLGVHINL